MDEFKKKVVWVTGSSTGIGRAIAIAFAERGADVIVHGNQNVEEATETLKLVNNHGVDGLLVMGDLSVVENVRSMIGEIHDKYGRLDVLINNAGTMVKRGKVEELSVETWQKIFDVNVNSVFHVTQAVIPLMKKQQEGKIINMTSLAARNGGGGGSVAYASAKAAVSTLTRGLARELVENNIRVNGIAPGVITTPFHDRYTSQEQRNNMTGQVPLGREGTPDEVAGVALFLASNHSSYITGEIIEVNGGLLMD